MSLKIPLWDSWLIGGDIFVAQLPSQRICWLAGPYGSGKTAFATFLSAWLLHKRLVNRLLTNIDVAGRAPVHEFVPEGMRYYSAYLEQWYEAGAELPMEDTVMLLDEGGRWLNRWSEAQDYVAALRKTNLYLLIPSVFRPVNQLTSFEVRRTRNLYNLLIPAWEYTWFLVNGKSVAEKGKFWLWRPHRLFGIWKTFAWPKDDGGLVDALDYTFGQDEIREKRAERQAKKAVTKIIDFSVLEDVAGNLAEGFEHQQAVMAGGLRGRK